MNERYGVDPAAPSSVLELGALLRNFGTSHGRFITDFPPEWPSSVRRHLGEVGPIEQARLEEWLSLGRRRALLPAERPYRDGMPWAKNAEYLGNSVAGCIGPVGCKPPVRAICDVLGDPAALADGSDALVPRTGEAYAEAARPLFLLSPKVVLVDPYFELMRSKNGLPTNRPSDRHRTPLKALLAAAVQSRKVEVFGFFVHEDRALAGDQSGTQFLSQVRELAKAVGAHRIHFEVEALRDDRLYVMHARYLLGNDCGLHFDHGFDVAGHGTNHVEWMGDGTLQPLLKRFMERRVTQRR